MIKKELDLNNLNIKKTFLNIRNTFIIFSIIMLALISDIAFGFTGYTGEGLTVMGKILLILFLMLPLVLLAFIVKLTRIVNHEMQKQFQSTTTLRLDLERITTQINRLEGNMLKLKSTQMNTVFNGSQVGSKIITDTENIGDKDLSQLELEVYNHNEYKFDLNYSRNLVSSDWDLILRALHFPKDKNDTAGFKALSLVRQDARMNELLRASEDFLTLLAQDGIYLDDLEIDPPPADSWAEFTKNDRNNLVKKLNCLEIGHLINQLEYRMKSDSVFRDANLVLLRRFDQFLREKLKSGSDSQIFNLASTRTGRAFMIAGQISKAF